MKELGGVILFIFVILLIRNANNVDNVDSSWYSRTEISVMSEPHVRNLFANPNTVQIHRRVVVSDNGRRIVQLQGQASGANAFGTRERFNFTVEWIWNESAESVVFSRAWLSPL